MNKKLRKLRNIASEAIRKRDNLNFKCFIEECPRKAISSHSQSRSNALRRISKKGHVILPRTLIFMKNYEDIDSYFQKVGIKWASTFKGFCGKHDNKYFSMTDVISQENISKETLTMLAFRTFAYEERTKEKGLFFLDYFAKKAMGICDISDTQMAALGMRLHLEVTRPYYLNRFIGMVESQDYEQICGILFILNKMIPLSCSAAIDPTMIDSDSLMEGDLQKPLDMIFFNLIPQTDSTLVLFAYFKEHELKLKEFISKLSRLENIIFNHCEEILISPSFYDSLTYEMKCKIMSGLRPWNYWKRENFPDLFHVRLESPVYI